MGSQTKPAVKASPDDLFTASENQRAFRRAHDAGHDEYVARCLRCNDFYRGAQWSQEDSAKLDSEGRPHLTLNLVLSTANAIIGEQMDRKMEIRYSPRGTGTDETAFELNQLTRFILQENRYDDTEDTVFADGIIGGRGYFDIRINYDKNLFGDIDIVHEDPVDIIPDPNAKDADPSTWSEFFISRWMTPDEIGVEYGDGKKEILYRLNELGSISDPDDLEYYSQTFAGRDDQGNDVERRKLRRVRVIERQYYEPTKALHWVDCQSGDFRMVPHHVEEDAAKAFAEQNGLYLMEKPIRRVRMTISADSVLLYDDWSPYRTFTIVPFFPYYRRGNPFGVVENLLSPQELLNKTSSQELHIVNTTANSGWIVEEGSLTNMDETDLEQRGAETGLVIVHRRGGTAPEKIQPNQIPAGIDRISQKAANTIRDVSAVNTAMLGLASSDASGRMVESQAARGQVQVSVILKNLQKCRRTLANKILELVQDFYTDTRYYQITHDDAVLGKSEQTRFINGVDEHGNILNDVTCGQYTVEAVFAPAAGSAAEMQFNEAKALRDLGIAIPDYVMVQYSQLRNRSELAELLKAQQGFGDQTPEQQQLQEAQMQNTMAKLQLEVQQIDAEIAQIRARTSLDEAKANSMDGYNQAAMQIHQLEQDRDLRMREMSMRIAMSAQSHYNQRYLNKFRAGSQMALATLQSTLDKHNNQSPKETADVRK